MQQFNVEDSPEKLIKKENIQEEIKLLPEPSPTVLPKKTGFDYRLLNFCVSNFILNMSIQIVVPFYPTLAHDEAGLNFFQIGIVFSCSPLGAIVMGIIAGAKMHTWGRRRTLIISLFVQSIALFLFGTLSWYTYNTSAFLAISVLSRLFQGFSRAAYGTITFAYVTTFWPEDVQKKIGLMESMTALGLSFGPMIGSGLNYAVGYSGLFFILGSTIGVAIIVQYYLLPADSTLGNMKERQKLNLGKALSSSQIVSTMILIMSVIGSLAFISPLIVNHMASFGLDQNTAAFIFTIPTFSYLLALNIVPRLQQKYSKAFVMSFGQIMCIFGALLCAPFWTSNPSTYAWLIVGQIVNGAAQACSVLPNIPYMMEILTKQFNDDPSIKNQIADLASGVFVTAFSLGGFISPIIGGQIYDSFGKFISIIFITKVEVIIIQQLRNMHFRFLAYAQVDLQHFHHLYFCLEGEVIVGGKHYFTRKNQWNRQQNVRDLLQQIYFQDDHQNEEDHNEVLSDSTSQHSDQSAEKNIRITKEQIKQDVKNS